MKHAHGKAPGPSARGAVEIGAGMGPRAGVCSGRPPRSNPSSGPVVQASPQPAPRTRCTQRCSARNKCNWHAARLSPTFDHPNRLTVKVLQRYSPNPRLGKAYKRLTAPAKRFVDRTFLCDGTITRQATRSVRRPRGALAELVRPVLARCRAARRPVPASQ
jgi:hypothetical protein